MTKPFSRLLIAGLLAVSTAATPVLAQTLQPLDRIAAVVNEDVVLQSELDRAVQNVLAQYANQPGQLPPRAVLERQVLERLVLVKLQVARAAETGVRVNDADLNNAVNAVAQQNGTTPDGLRQIITRKLDTQTPDPQVTVPLVACARCGMKLRTQTAPPSPPAAFPASVASKATPPRRSVNTWVAPAVAGFAGWWVAVAGGVLTGWLLWLAVKFRRDRTRPSARRLFFATLAYLPIALIVVLAGSRQG